MADRISSSTGNRRGMLRGVMMTLFMCAGSLYPLLLHGQAPTDHPRDLLMIVNKSSTVDAVSIAELKNLFLKKRERWKNGDKVVPVNASANSSLRAAFVKQVLKMGLEAEREYWSKFKIRKGSGGPAEFGNTLKAVFTLKSAVGYVYREEYKEGVAKIVLVIPN